MNLYALAVGVPVTLFLFWVRSGLKPALVRAGEPYPLHQPNQLFRNLGGDGQPGRFAEVSARAGEVFTLSEVSRGAAFGDVEGMMEILVASGDQI